MQFQAHYKYLFDNIVAYNCIIYLKSILFQVMKSTLILSTTYASCLLQEENIK